MKAFFKDIFEYHHFYNQKLIDVFLEHSNKIYDRTVPLFSHCLNAHQIWNSRILNTKALDVFELHKLDTFKSIDLSNYNDSLKIIDTFDFDETLVYKNSKGTVYENKVKDILFHITNHFTHHKGQLISDLRQHGIEPVITDYILYKR